jgi:hypothetical protein
MKFVIKRSYCPACHKLVRAREEKVGSDIDVVCTQCGKHLYSWNGIRWKSVSDEPAREPIAAGLPLKANLAPNASAAPAGATAGTHRPAVKRKAS